MTRAEADALLIETEQRCSIEEWDCDADPGCEPAPPGAPRAPPASTGGAPR
ncbi:MAG: hypothetical protein H6708_25330 [Kofleriaceae bacterium]|nr:hypothetical protein [Kofleriaceae bacterium]